MSKTLSHLFKIKNLKLKIPPERSEVRFGVTACLLKNEPTTFYVLLV